MNRAPTLVALTEDELARLNGQAAILRDVGAQLIAPSDAAAQLGWSLGKVRRKLRALKKHGVVALVRKLRADRGRARVADEKVVAKIKTEYLKPYRPFATNIYKEIVKDFDLSNAAPPSYSFVLRKTREIDPDLVARFRMGERTYNDKFAYWSQRRKPPAPRLWADGDHHPWDRPVIFRDQTIGRPQLTALRDECTLEILGFSVNVNQTAGKYSNRRTIAHVLRQAIMRKQDPRWPSFGIFEHFYSDMGRDFRSKFIRAVCHDLGITPILARGYHGQSKAIERWFRTMEDALRHLPGYIGNSPQNNPEKDVIGAARTWEEMRKDLMTIDQLEAALTDWILDVYHHQESRALKGLTPMAALESHVKNGWTAREIRDERALDLLLMERLDRGKRPIKVNRGKIQAFGSKWEARYFFAPELLELSGQEVQVLYDPDRLGELYIYKGARFVCVAKNAELLDFGATKEDLQRKLEIERHQKRRVNERYEEILKQAQYGDPLKRAIAERNREEVLREDREKIAVNAEAESVTVMLPKYQQAAKQLKAAPAAKRERRKPAPGDDDLMSSDELFKAKRNPWLDEEEA